MNEVEQRLVAPFYMKVLHGNLVRLASDAERETVLRQMRAVAADVTFADAGYLWMRGWRSALMASWWAAVWRWQGTADRVGSFLIPSRDCFEGQAHCLALARVNSPRSREVLAGYLGEYLPRTDLDYDQPWAMAALTLACAGVGEGVPDWIQAAWPRWAAWPGRRADLDEYVGIVGQMMTFAGAVAGRPPAS